MSNIKQMTLGTLQYCSDYDENGPHKGSWPRYWSGAWATCGGQMCGWNTYYAADMANGMHQNFAELISPYAKNTQLFFCPSAGADTTQYPKIPYWTTVVRKGQTTTWVVPGNTYSAADTAILLDPINGKTGGNMLPAGCGAAPTAAPDGAHSGTFNVGYLDGHAKAQATMNALQLNGTTLPNGTWAW